MPPERGRRNGRHPAGSSGEGDPRETPPDGGAFLKQTRRERLRDLLATRDDGFSLEEIEDIFDARRSTVLSDLRHLQLSLRHRPEQMLIIPPRCDTCGYVFKVEEPRWPSKCPDCKSVEVVAPVFKVARAES